MKLRIALVMGAAAALAITLMIGLAGRAARLAADVRLTADAWGPVKIGMSRSEAEGALHAKFDVDDSASGPDDCFYAWAGARDRPKPRMVLQFVEGRLAVISLRDGSIRTGKGVKIGDPESVVQATYGPQLQKTPVPNFDDTDPRHQLYFWNAARHGLLFWIDERRSVV